MRNYSSIFFYLLIGVFAFLTSSLKNLRFHEAEESLKEHLQKMVYIEGGEIYYGYSELPQYLDSDSTLLRRMNYNKHVVSPFYMSATEVTTKEWWDFYNAKIIEMGNDKATRVYYPDSLALRQEFNFVNSRRMVNSYFWNIEYDDFPVMCISYNQAKKYCEWKSSLLSGAARKVGADIKFEVRLPNEAEWERAAGQPIISEGMDTRVISTRMYPWERYSYLKDGKYFANFGIVTDQNGVHVKAYAEDGALYCSETGTYPPNSNGLYDMAGNVAEWVDLTPEFDFEDEMDRYFGVDYHKREKWSDDRQKTYQEHEEHNRKLNSGKNKVLAKGGSCMDGLAYLQIGARQVFDKYAKVPRVGFRIAVSDPGKKYRKYFPKKTWKPK